MKPQATRTHPGGGGVTFDKTRLRPGLTTARLPLGRVLDFQCRRGESADITTLAVVQLLLLRREFGGAGFGEGGWGSAISRCPALRCAPLRKYVRWRPPYEALNDGARPAQLEWLEGWGKEVAAQDCLKASQI